MFGLPWARGVMSLLNFHRHSLQPDRSQNIMLARYIDRRLKPAVNVFRTSFHAVSKASLALKVSIGGLIISATPGIASALSKIWFRVDIAGRTKQASILRGPSDNCASMPLTLSI